MGCCDSRPPGFARRISLEKMLCESCNLTFNRLEKYPMIICANQHNACKQCLDLLVSKNIGSCPFCRIDIQPNLAVKNTLLLQLLEDGQATVDKRDGKVVRNRSPIFSTLMKAKELNCQPIIDHILMNATRPLREITLLNLEQSGLQETIDLTIFEGLKKLDLDKNALSSIGHLGTLPALEFLCLNRNKITVIANLEPYTTLTRLFLFGNKIAKIENLGALRQLEVLKLGNNQIEKIENLESLVKLQELWLGFNKIKVIENLDHLKELTRLGLQNNRIAVIENIFSLPKLKQLKMMDNPFDRDQNRAAIKAVRDLYKIDI